MRTRPLKPSFFKNEVIAECGLAARLLLQGLWTLADRRGIIEHRPMKIKADVFPFDDRSEVDVDGNLKVLESKGLIHVYKVDGKAYIQVPNFENHARPHPDEKPNTKLPSPPTADAQVPTATQESITADAPIPSTSCANTPIPNTPIPIPSYSSHSAAPASPEADERGKASGRLAAKWLHRRPAHTEHDRKAHVYIDDVLAAGVSEEAVSKAMDTFPKAKAIWEFCKSLDPRSSSNASGKSSGHMGTGRVAVDQAAIDRDAERRAAQKARREGDGVQAPPPDP